MSGSFAVIFDLDGTLIDSLPDIARSVNAALEATGEAPRPIADFPGLIGGGAENLIRRALGEPREHRTPEVLAAYRAHYTAHMLDHTLLFDGMAELLDALAALGTPMAVLSNKPDAPTKRLGQALLGRWPLAPIFGEREGVPKKPDPTAALEVAQLMGRPPSGCIFVGDSAIDVATAKNAGMRAVGVAWGYRSDELEAAGAEAILRQPLDLLPLLSQLARAS